MIRITFRQLEYFEALAETLHFGRAAALSGVTQPALSAQISELEEKLGRRLFERGSRTVRLTDDGSALRVRIEGLLRDARSLEESAARLETMRGRFRLGVIPTVAPYILPPLLSALRDSHPALLMELRETVTDTLTEELLAGRLDAMVVALPVRHSALNVEPLFEDGFRLAVPANDPGFVDPPVAPESPALERLMLLEEGHCMRDQALALCGAARPAALSNFGATSLTTLLQMVAHGQGLTLVPDMAVRSGTLPADIRVVPFSAPQPSRTLGLVWRRNASRQVDCRALADLIRAVGLETRDVERELRPHEGEHHEA
jgi:LysR family transcriptional regulator, hydrogen peroxide-inducible genes activator